MIYHIMKDGTKHDSVDGYIVKYEQKKELYNRLSKMKVRDKHDNENTSGDFRKKQILDR